MEDKFTLPGTKKWKIPTPPEGKYTAIVYDTQTKQTKEVSVSKEVGDTIFIAASRCEG